MNSGTNPYSTYSTNAAPNLNMNVQNQIKVQQKDEEGQKSSKILPHTAESLKEYLSQMYVSLMEVKHIAIQTEKEPGVKKEDIEEVLQIVDEIGQKITMDLSNSIDKLYI
jgi:hypothetical protein